MPDINKMINWMSERKGKVTYSMAARLGPISYDCSSAVYLALIAGGFLPQGKMGNTDSLFGDLEANGWQKVALNSKGYYDVKRGDIFIWGDRGASSGASGHTGIFVDDKDNIVHCNYGYNGITINNHDILWEYNGRPEVTIYRYTGKTDVTPSKNDTPATQPQPVNPTGLISKVGTFYPNQQLPVSGDTNPDDNASPALAYYNKGQAINYDSYVASNGYMWISYIGASGNRRYVAVGPDDGNTDTTWGTGFFN